MKEGPENEPEVERYQITNKAAYRYLKALLDSDPPLKLPQGKVDKRYAALIKQIRKIDAAIPEDGVYKHKRNYAVLYTTLHELSEKIKFMPSSKFDSKNDVHMFHRHFFTKLYENHSELYKDIQQELIENTDMSMKAKKEQQVHIKERLKEKKIKGPGPFQFTHPDNWANKLFSGLFGIDYNPLKRTNMPYVAFARQDGGKQPHVLRMGTQVQGLGTLQPSFLNYLATKQDQSKPDQVHHIYFNLQKRDLVKKGLFERFFENRRTKTLEKINDKQLGAVVLTLPADSATFLEGYSKKLGRGTTDKKYNESDLKKMLIESITKDINDFYIPDNIKRQLFGDKLQNLDGSVTDMLKASVAFVLGPKGDPTKITAEQRQAILFDFVKFQLSSFITQSLSPDTINFSCKDAIDRGGVHALWHEFRRRLGSGNPMSAKEFNQHLDASALLVKGRPVNDHRNLIWNVMNEAFINNREQLLEAAPWTKQWLIDNYPTDKKIRHIRDKVENGKTLSKDESKQLNEHVARLNAFVNRIEPREKIIKPEPVVIKPEPQSRVLTQFKKETATEEVKPILQQTACNAMAIHQLIKDNTIPEFQGMTSSLIPNGTGQTRAQIKLDGKTEVLIDDDPTQGTRFSVKGDVNPKDCEKVAHFVVQAVLQFAKPGIILDISVCEDPVKKEIMQRVINKALSELNTKEGFKDNPARIVDQPIKKESEKRSSLSL